MARCVDCVCVCVCFAGSWSLSRWCRLSIRCAKLGPGVGMLGLGLVLALVLGIWGGRLEVDVEVVGVEVKVEFGPMMAVRGPGWG